MHTLRTRFKKDIVAEFLPPARPTKRAKVIIVCGGMPGYNSKAGLLEFFSKKGYWAFSFRYRGTWESNGRFLQTSPHQDVLDIINGLPKGFKDFFGNKSFKVKPEEIFLLGVSFGGPAALLASRDPRVSKVVALCPVVNWRAQSRDESLPFLKRFTEQAFGQAYRPSKNGWAKIKSGKFYNAVNHVSEIDGRKVLIFHAKDDGVVAYAPVAKFAQDINAKLITLKTGGHLSSSLVPTPRFYKHIKQFLK